MSYHGHFEEKKPQKPSKKPMKKGKKIALIVLTVLLVLIIGVVIAVKFAFQSAWGKVTPIVLPTYETTEVDATETTGGDATGVTETTDVTEETEVPPMTADDIINILVVGQSSRGGEEAALADTMILASVNTYTKTLTLTSFLRDTYVDLPDYRDSSGTKHTCGWNKLTSCYALGYNWGGTADAMAMMNQCLYDNFGVEVDYNFEIDFDCFIKLVDILGGVGLTITEAEANYLNADDRFVHTDYEAGKVTLDGSAALSYARMRKAEGDSDSDIKRTSRQRYLIKCLLNNIRSSSLTQIQSIINEVLPLIATTMTSDEMMDLLFKLVPMLPDLVVEGGTCPVEGTYWSDLKETPDGEFYVLCFAADQQKKLMRAITEAEGLDTAAAAAN